jgi:hypothetical protein
MSDEVEMISNRKLATIQKIVELKPIFGADRIEVALMENLGWECVVKKGEVKVGDLVCYIETDSKLPDRPEFEFMRERRYKVKIAKFRQQVSQGLILPIDSIPGLRHALISLKTIEVGDDVTTLLGITNYVKDKENEEENSSAQQLIRKSRAPKWLMNMAWFRWIYLRLNSKVKGNWPVQFAGPKSDETRIQVCAKILMANYDKEWYICEKIDGMSSTFFTYLFKRWGIKVKCFGVCSRNIWLKTKNNSAYWKIAEKYGLDKLLLKLDGLYSLQGELMGEGIQGNKYKIKDNELYVFNVSKDGKKLSFQDMYNFCLDNGLKFVPIVSMKFIPSKEIGEGKTVQEAIQWLVEYSRGNSQLFKRNREGIVVRLCDNPNVSFKVINPDFMLEEAKRD